MAEKENVMEKENVSDMEAVSEMEALGNNDKLKPYKGRKVRCNECNGCLAQDCLKCKYCIDKYEGPKKLKKACILKNCEESEKV